MDSVKKKILILIAIAIISVMGHPHSFFAQENKNPEIVIEEKIYDAKEVNEGSIIEHKFKVMNRGEGPLEIKQVRPG